ncbi:tRNA lysidine(34) synthetase TilS [Eubacteriales bacterium OttesenSCG-928-N13]|nr:tRNA lysidine(34) synthetase TilS [Eubacteriales bacterium OttesenSCG-928-N13]
MDDLLTRLWRPGAHVLAAVSGGADSVALLLLLHERSQLGEIRLSAAHFEHGIRGQESLRDMHFVMDLCKRLQVPLSVGNEDVPELAAAQRMGLEQAAREARHRFLQEEMQRLGADCIALAHHKDDQAETVLMHLLRGAGADGACGMRARQGALVRPLLGASKQQLLDYLEERHQNYVLDGTNLLPNGPRNQLRLSAMPLLKQIYPGAEDALCRFARISQDQIDLLDRLAWDWLESHMAQLPMGRLIAYAAQRDLSGCGGRAMPFRADLAGSDRSAGLADAGAERALVSQALHGLYPGVGYDQIERLTALYFDQNGLLSIAGGVLAKCSGRGIYLLDEAANPPMQSELKDGAKLGDYATFSMQDAPALPIRDDPYRDALNKSALQGAVIRTRREGDRFQMLGAPGDRLLSDVLIDRKVDEPVRDWLPLVAIKDRILWIPGIGIAEQAKITPDCEATMLIYDGIRLI